MSPGSRCWAPDRSGGWMAFRSGLRSRCPRPCQDSFCHINIKAARMASRFYGCEACPGFVAFMPPAAKLQVRPSHQPGLLSDLCRGCRGPGGGGCTPTSLRTGRGICPGGSGSMLRHLGGLLPATSRYPLSHCLTQYGPTGSSLLAQFSLRRRCRWLGSYIS